MSGPEARDDADVAVVGGGPVGVLLANLLGLHGLRTVVFEREAGIHPMPRAIHFDGEVMRVFETAGLRAAVETVARPGLKGMHFVNAQGQTLLIRGGTAAEGPHGCATNHYFHQPELEAVLRQGLARFAHVRLLARHEVTAIEVQDDGAELQVQPAEGPARRWRARQVVGCDGARSLVRRLIGGGSLDLGLHQPWLVFDVRLSHERPDLPDHTVQHCGPARPKTFCHVTGDRRRWEIMLMPGDDPAEMVRPERIWPLVAPWMGPEDASIERAVIYTFHSVIAQGWRRGPLLLAGDSAHQTPPFLGQGLCAGVRDAANLAWKLAAVLRQGADPALLDTYESERAPHVQAFIELAVRLGGVIQATDPEAARARDAHFLGGAPEVFEFPVPQLGPGLWAGAHAAAGRVFGQPRLADGRRLDEPLGQGWGLVAPRAWRDELAAAASSLKATWIDAADAGLRPLLQARGLHALLLRPDRYVAAAAPMASTADTAQALAAQIAALAGRLQAQRPVHA